MQKQMDLPPDKIRTLREVDLKKKWNLVCDQRQFSKDNGRVTEPIVYLEKLKMHMDKKTQKKVSDFLLRILCLKIPGLNKIPLRKTNFIIEFFSR